ncbi:MAG: hypothetical protein JWM63_2065 [Gammaproteobacteria bacterium]|jgi:hypothetical protein|nr:hypothetical protein [Gammaproteobacteria bacterium]
MVHYIGRLVAARYPQLRPLFPLSSFQFLDSTRTMEVFPASLGKLSTR